MFIYTLSYSAQIFDFVFKNKLFHSLKNQNHKSKVISMIDISTQWPIFCEAQSHIVND